MNYKKKLFVLKCSISIANKHFFFKFDSVQFKMFKEINASIL